MKSTTFPGSLSLLSVLLALGTPAQATPFFARTYHMSCETCHAGFPRLNEFGLDFKANNFRIPGAEKSAFLAWQKTIPLAVQVEPTYERFTPSHSLAQFTDTQLLAGGLLTPTTSFYVHHSLWIDDKPLEFPSYEVWVQQILDERSKLMLKAGQFELPFAYSPAINMATVFQPLVFGAGLQGNDVVLGSPMRGLQLSGIAAKRVRFYVDYGAPSLLAPGNTAGHREFFGEFQNLFVRISNRDLAHNIGVFMYFTHSPLDPNKPATRDDGQRYGIDGTYYWKGFQFYAMGVYGQNRNPLGNGTGGALRSGFVEANRMLLPWLGIAARYEAQTIDEGGKGVYSDAETFSLRVYPVEHLRLIAEFQQADHGMSATAILAALAF